METSNGPATGEAISQHLHKATGSLHALLLLYAEAGFDSLPADTLQDMLLKLVSNVTNASRLFTQHQKIYDTSISRSEELAETVRRLSSLVRQQQEQIRSLKAEVDSDIQGNNPHSEKVSCGTMTDFDVSALEEQLLVLKTEIWLKDTQISEYKQGYVRAMESYKKKLSKARAQSSRVTEDTQRVMDAQQDIIDELREEVHRWKAECKTVRMERRHTARSSWDTYRRGGIGSGSGVSTRDERSEPEPIDTAARSTEYPEIFGSSRDASSGQKNSSTIDRISECGPTKPLNNKKPLNAASTPATEEFEEDEDVEDTPLRPKLSRSLSSELVLEPTQGNESRGQQAHGEYTGNDGSDSEPEPDSLEVEEVEPSRSDDEAEISDGDDRGDDSQSDQLYKDGDLSISCSEEEEEDGRGIEQSLDEYGADQYLIEGGSEGEDDINYDVEIDTSGEYLVHPSHRDRYADTYSDDGSQGLPPSERLEDITDGGVEDVGETRDVFWKSIKPEASNEPHWRSIEESGGAETTPIWAGRVTGSIEDSFAMIQNYYG